MTPEMKSEARAMEMRLAVKRRLIGWGLVADVSIELGYNDHPASVLLAQAFGYDDYHAFTRSTLHPDTYKKLEAFMGEHGYTLFKAMLARRENGTS